MSRVTKPKAETAAGRNTRRSRSRIRAWFTKFLGGRGWLYALLAVLGSLVALSEYADRTFENSRRVAQEQYAMVVGNLGSPSLVVRVGALGQLPALMRQDVPARGPRPRATEGLMYLLGFDQERSTYPYHDDLLRVIRALVAVPKRSHQENGLESEALFNVLCEIGSEGWYNAQAMRKEPTRDKCLSWIWSNAPDDRLFDIPAYRLFRGAELRDVDLSRKDLRRAEFSGARIQGGSFADSSLSRAHFEEGVLVDVSFVNADLRYVDFSRARLRQVSFSGASLQYASFAGATFEDASADIFDQANLAGVDFRGAVTDGVRFEYALNPHLAQGLEETDVAPR